MKIIISGGGTGGHIFPAIAIADALKAEHPNVEILFVGAKGKMEMEKVPRAGYTIKGLPIAGFHRQRIWRNWSFPFKLVASLWSAYSIVKSFKPNGAVGVGGYASGPLLKMASWLGVKTFIQEQNSFAGVTNKLLAQKAEQIFVAYENMDRFFTSDKIILSGNPVRSDICENRWSYHSAKKAMNLNKEQKVVLILGGSLGARTLNEAIDHHLKTIAERQDVLFYWQVGKLYEEEFKSKKIAQLDNVKMVSFIEDMAQAYAMADVVVARAGALTISELMVVSKSSILVPSPNVAEDHQTHNAMALVNRGAALMIKDNEARKSLIATTLELLDDNKKQSELVTEINKMKKTDAAQVIAKSIVKRLGLKN